MLSVIRIVYIWNWRYLEISVIELLISKIVLMISGIQFLISSIECLISLNHCWYQKTQNKCHFGVPYYITMLVQEKRNFIANALELRLSCTKPSKWYAPGGMQWSWLWCCIPISCNKPNDDGFIVFHLIITWFRLAWYWYNYAIVIHGGYMWLFYSYFLWLLHWKWDSR